MASARASFVPIRSHEPARVQAAIGHGFVEQIAECDTRSSGSLQEGTPAARFVPQRLGVLRQQELWIESP